MVEMMEANYALQNANEKSLVLFDEIGRGTSTYDGMSLAQAMLEYLHNNTKAKTLFSTHYHELTSLEEEYSGIKNVHVDVKEEGEEVTFLYRIRDGKADKSYGINVARLAKLPNEVLNRAQQILNHIQKEEIDLHVEKAEIKEEVVVSDPRGKAICEMIDAIDLNKMTPLDAMMFLCELKRK
jgi:DNA mismatch repair protein MutS